MKYVYILSGEASQYTCVVHLLELKHMGKGRKTIHIHHKQIILFILSGICSISSPFTLKGVIWIMQYFKTYAVTFNHELSELRGAKAHYVHGKKDKKIKLQLLIQHWKKASKLIFLVVCNVSVLS